MLRGTGDFWQNGGTKLEGKSLRALAGIWFLLLLICTPLVAAAFIWVDVPIARHVHGILGKTETLAAGFTSSILLGIEAAVVLTLVISRITHGHLSKFRETAGLACLTSICAYAINASILKVFFGVSNTVAVLHGAPHAFHLLGGALNSSFPSGHMVLAGAFAGVFIRLYRATIALFAALLFVAAMMLIVGDWHFVSDVIAGAFVGISAGLLAGEVWLVHAN